MFKILLLISELRLLCLINMCYLGTKGETDTGEWLERVWEGNFVLSDAEGNILRPLQSSNGRYVSVTNIISNLWKVGKAMILGSDRLFYFISMNKLGKGGIQVKGYLRYWGQLWETSLHYHMPKLTPLNHSIK